MSGLQTPDLRPQRHVDVLVLNHAEARTIDETGAEDTFVAALASVGAHQREDSMRCFRVTNPIGGMATEGESARGGGATQDFLLQRAADIGVDLQWWTS